MQNNLPGPLSEEPLGPQMANRLSFVFTVMLRTEGCDISQEDVCAHRSVARLGEGKCHPSYCISDGQSQNTQTVNLCRMSTEVKSESKPESKRDECFTQQNNVENCGHLK